MQIVSAPSRASQLGMPHKYDIDTLADGFANPLDEDDITINREKREITCYCCTFGHGNKKSRTVKLFWIEKEDGTKFGVGYEVDSCDPDCAKVEVEFDDGRQDNVVTVYHEVNGEPGPRNYFVILSRN